MTILSILSYASVERDSSLGDYEGQVTSVGNDHGGTTVQYGAHKRVCDWVNGIVALARDCRARRSERSLET